MDKKEQEIILNKMKNRKEIANPMLSSTLAGRTGLPAIQNLPISLPALPHRQKARLLTMYIKNKRDSSRIKVYSPFQHFCRLKDLYFEIAYFSYTHR